MGRSRTTQVKKAKATKGPPTAIGLGKGNAKAKTPQKRKIKCQATQMACKESVVAEKLAKCKGKVGRGGANKLDCKLPVATISTIAKRKPKKLSIPVAKITKTLENNARRKTTDVDVQRLAKEIMNIRRSEKEVLDMTLEEQEKELQEVIQEHSPTFSFSALYIRLGRRYRRHYNTDSIAVLRTLAQQTGVFPLELLNSLKTYRVIKPQKKDSHKPYGFKFEFAYFKTKSETFLRCGNPELESTIKGLQLTSSLLEAEVVKNSDKTFMNLGRKRESASDEVLFKLPSTRVNKPKTKPTDRDQHLQDVEEEAPALSNSKRKSSRLAAKVNKEMNSLLKTDSCLYDYDATDLVESQDGMDDESYQEQEETAGGSIDKQNQDLNWYDDQPDFIFALGDEDEYQHKDEFQTKALLRTHIMTTFDKRIWSQIELRFLCFQVILFVFGRALTEKLIRPMRPPENGGVLDVVDDHPLLHLSYCTTSDCTERREYLRVLTNFCIVFPDEEAVIANADALAELWEKREEYTIGRDIRTFLNKKVETNRGSIAEKMNRVFKHFQDLHRGINVQPKGDHTKVEAAEKKWWLCICANVFRHFLQYKENNDIKEKLTKTSVEDDELEISPPKPRGKRGKRTQPKRSNKKARGSEEAAIGESAKEWWEPNQNQERAELPATLSFQALLQQRKDELRKEKGKESTGSCTPTTESPERTKEALPLVHPSVEHKNSLSDLRDNRDIVARLRLAAPGDLQAAGVSSQLVIEHPDYKYHSWLSSLELYLANLLGVYRHGRQNEYLQENQKLPELSSGDAHVLIPPEKAEHIDKDRNVLHVARECSEMFRLSPYLDLFRLDIPLLINALLDNFKNDEGRSPNAIEVNFGAASSQKPTQAGEFPEPTGMGQDCFVRGNEKADEILTMLGNWGVFVFDTCQTMLRKASKAPLAIREFAANRMKKFLRIPDQYPFGFEHVTIRLQEISKFFLAHNLMHTDRFNCRLPGSSYTSGLNMCVVDPDTSRLYLLQVIFNYRSAVTTCILPCYKSVLAVTDHISELIQNITNKFLELYQDQQLIFGMPSPIDMRDFYMDENLKYEKINIGEKNGTPIELECITLPIGFSRIFSMSAAVYVLQEARPYLTMEQMVELCFIVSLLNTSSRFYYTINTILEEIKSGARSSFSDHPFDDWLFTATKIFGTWQGGPRPRYQCAGVGNIGNIFGRYAVNGTEKLKKVVAILCEFLKWVDLQKGRDSPGDISIPELEERMKKVIADVAKEAGPNFANFGLFRLSIFLTMAIGASLTKPGKHARQMFFPAVGMASRNHIDSPCSHDINITQAQALEENGDEVNTDFHYSVPIQLDEFDLVMRIVCSHLGLSHSDIFRDFFECALCESKDGRKLFKVDVLIKGVPVYILNNQGCLMKKIPGRTAEWTKVEPHPLKETIK